MYLDINYFASTDLLFVIPTIMGYIRNFMLIRVQFTKWVLMMVFLLIFHIVMEKGEATRSMNPWADSIIRQPTYKIDEDSDQQDTRWAVLVAGSNGYGNYRHQVPFSFFFFLLAEIINANYVEYYKIDDNLIGGFDFN